MEYQNGNLIISGNKCEKKEDLREKYCLKERTYGQFSRTYHFGNELNPDSIKVTVSNKNTDLA